MNTAMSNRAPVALAIGVGYLLGRSHKMRWAIILGTAAASGRLNGLSGQLVEQATKTIAASPELSKLGTSAQRLLDAGRSAAVSALSSRVESASGALEDRLGATVGSVGSAGRDKDDGRRSEDSRGRNDEPDDEYDEDEDLDDQDDQDDQDDYADEPAAKDDEEVDEEAGGGRKPAVVRKGRR